MALDDKGDTHRPFKGLSARGHMGYDGSVQDHGDVELFIADSDMSGRTTDVGDWEAVDPWFL